MSPFETKVAGAIPISFDAVARHVVLLPDSGALGCAECHAPIDLHQPDQNQPATLLGTCLECSRWFLVLEMEDACRRTLLVELPSADKIREAVEAFQSRGT
jgi:hypothetical protein